MRKADGNVRQLVPSSGEGVGAADVAWDQHLIGLLSSNFHLASRDSAGVAGNLKVWAGWCNHLAQACDCRCVDGCQSRNL